MDWWCNNSLTLFKVNSGLIISGTTGSGKTIASRTAAALF